MLCPYCLSEDATFEKKTDTQGRPIYYCDRCPKKSKPPVPITYVAEPGRYPSLPVSFVGLRGHGKTCFLHGLLWKLRRVGATAWDSFTFAPLGETMHELEKSLKQLQNRRVPKPTDLGTFPIPQIFRFERIPGLPDLQMFFYDNSGEAFDSSNVTQVCNFYGYATKVKALVWFISLPKLTTDMELDRLFHLYREAVMTLGSNCKDQSLVVVLTMADEMDEEQMSPTMVEVRGSEHPPREGYSWEFLDRLSEETRDWLRQNEESNQHNFVGLVEGSFNKVYYCIASALGRKPNLVPKADNPREQELVLDGDPSPRGVLIPLYWMARLQLPLITVKPPNGAPAQDYFSLVEALAAAGPRATVQLAAGNYELHESLEVSHPITLVGAGMDKTQVISRAGANGITFHADLVCKGVTFHHDGPTNGVVVACHRVEMSACRFSGAMESGLLIKGNTTGTVRDCAASDNAGSGLTLWGNANVKLERNTCTNNGLGLMFGMNATGQASGNTLKENSVCGVCVSGAAKPQLHNNTCTDNEEGIRYKGKAGGVALDNTCDGNEKYGILVTEEAAPVLEKNRCRRNTLAGIRYSHSDTTTPGGTARANQCHKTVQGPGIHVRGKAKVQLIENTCSENDEAGILLEGSTEGTAESNECDDNTGPGIEVKGTARVELHKNRCRKNEGAGLAVDEAARGKATENECQENGGCGIEVSGTATLEATQNHCTSNARSGIVFESTEWGSSVLRQNTCHHNHKHGIHVARTSHVILVDNRVMNNRASNVRDERRAGAWLRFVVLLLVLLAAAGGGAAWYFLVGTS